jgi:serine/threonine protein kinase
VDHLISKPKYGLACLTVKSVIVKKPGSKKEAEFIAKLLSNPCSSIVHTFNMQIIDSNLLLHQEALDHYTIPEGNIDMLVDSCEMTLDILGALKHLKNMGIIHRDISPNNIMRSSLDGTFKLIDFNCAVWAEDGQYENRGVVGTDGYIPERVVNGKCNYSFCTDLQSFGMVLAEWFKFLAMFSVTEEEEWHSETMDFIICDLCRDNYCDNVQLDQLEAKVFDVYCKALPLNNNVHCAPRFCDKFTHSTIMTAIKSFSLTRQLII